MCVELCTLYGRLSHDDFHAVFLKTLEGRITGHHILFNAASLYHRYGLAGRGAGEFHLYLAHNGTIALNSINYRNGTFNYS